jgi:hypothetical protein
MTECAQPLASSRGTAMSKNRLPRSSKSKLDQVDDHTIAPEEYEELPELTEEMLARAVVRQRGRPTRMAGRFTRGPESEK